MSATIHEYKKRMNYDKEVVEDVVALHQQIIIIIIATIVVNYNLEKVKQSF